MTEIKKKILNMQVEINSLKTAVKLYKKNYQIKKSCR